MARQTQDGWQGVVKVGNRTVWTGKKYLDRGSAEHDATQAANMYRDRHEATGKVAKRRHGVRKVKVTTG